MPYTGSQPQQSERDRFKYKLIAGILFNALLFLALGISSFLGPAAAAVSVAMMIAGVMCLELGIFFLVIGFKMRNRIVKNNRDPGDNGKDASIFIISGAFAAGVGIFLICGYAIGLTQSAALFVALQSLGVSMMAITGPVSIGVVVVLLLVACVVGCSCSPSNDISSRVSNNAQLDVQTSDDDITDNLKSIGHDVSVSPQSNKDESRTPSIDQNNGNHSSRSNEGGSNYSMSDLQQQSFIPPVQKGLSRHTGLPDTELPDTELLEKDSSNSYPEYQLQ